MASLDLRPLSLGEILDRAFSLYRSHFLLFIGIAAIPSAVNLAANLIQVGLNAYLLKSAPESMMAGLTIGVALRVVFMLIAVVCYFVSQAGSVRAVSELYLGRETTITASLGGVREHIAPLFGVFALSVLLVGFGLLMLIIPGLCVALRLMIAGSAVVIERRGPAEALRRSWDLVADNVGRAFLIVLLGLVIGLALTALFEVPFLVMMFFARDNPGMLQAAQALVALGSFVAATLGSPIGLIANSLFYFDLRVRKEGFDLQYMMNPDQAISGPRTSMPSIAP